MRWAAEATVGARADAAHALARAYLHSDVGQDVRDEMEATLTLLLDDEDVTVRFALADAFANSERAPRHMVLALARDQYEIARVVLARSPVFVDAELVDIVASSSPDVQAVISSRPAVEGTVAAAIAEVGSVEAVEALLANPNVEMARLSLRRIADRFGDDFAVREALLARLDLPIDAQQALIRRISMTLPAADADGPDSARETCDRATVVLAAECSLEELQTLVEHLRVTGQLTTSLLLRGLCAGNVGLFEVALATLCQMPMERIVGLVRHPHRGGLRAVYRRAGLPLPIFDAFVAAIDSCSEFDVEAGSVEHYGFSREMTDRVIERFVELTGGEPAEVLGMLRRFAADASRSAARAYLEARRQAA
ncbi:MAG: DUF2336 domain-containing protein [Bauldia sp.]